MGVPMGVCMCAQVPVEAEAESLEIELQAAVNCKHTC